MQGTNKPPAVEYHPPAQDVITHFAQAVGEELGGEYANTDVISGLADFLTVIARILAADLNRKGQNPFDNRIE
jgi:hypothetical protein